MSKAALIANEKVLLAQARIIARRFGIDMTQHVVRSKLGLTNGTFLFARSKPQAVVQLISAECHQRAEDIDKVLRHLRIKSVRSPQLFRSAEGDLCIASCSGWWRASTLIPGYSIDSNPSVAQTQSAATVMAQVHRAFLDFQAPLVTSTTRLQDPEHLFAGLSRATKRLRGRTIAAVEEATTALLRRFDAMPQTSLRGKLRLLHGDPKPANFVFKSGTMEAVSIVDFDTIGKYPLAFDIGDMLRSFCAVRHSGRPPTLNPLIWDAVLASYSKSCSDVSSQDWGEVDVGFELVTMQLAARCLLATYEEKPSPGGPSFDVIQNLRRAGDMLLLLDDFDRKRGSLQRMIDTSCPEKL